MLNKKEFVWNFDNSYARLPEEFFRQVQPSPVKSPKLVMLNTSLAATLELDASLLEQEAGIEVIAGNRIPKGGFPLAQAYAGHQFGHLTMLGDGRALLLGEQITSNGKRFDIQLKGSGRTPFSRGGDGRAALAPMLREYLISEAMFALGVPTTRSLAVVATGEAVLRDKKLPGAVLTRVATSHLRVGTFQYAAGLGEFQHLKSLADYALERHFPADEAVENRYLFLLQEVIKRQAKLVASWQLIGFVHGVMNTDNMTISGETIDYGPCAFMDMYASHTVFSSIDTKGRYAYGNQPYIAGWNLARFAETLLPLLHDDQEQALQLAQEEMTVFSKLYRQYWLSGMRRKLGLFNEEQGDEELVDELLSLMEKHHVDFTNTFVALTEERVDNSIFFGNGEFLQWQQRWQARQQRQQQSRDSIKQLMKESNPVVIPRNHRVEEALEAAVEHGDYSVMKRLLTVLSRPFDYSDGKAGYCEPPKPSNKPYRTFCGT